MGVPRRKRQQGDPLSTREREILGLLAAGASGGEIANTLVLSPDTIRTHIRNAMTKLGASSRTHAVVLALRRGEIAQSDARDDAPHTSRESSGSAAPLAHVHARGRAASLEGREELATVLRQLASLYDVDTATLFVIDDDGLALRCAASMNDADDLEADPWPEAIVLGHGPLGRAALERRAQVVQGWRTLGNRNPTVFVPMVASGRLLGAICLAVRSSRFVGRGELLLLHTFANRVAEILLSPGPTTGKLKRTFMRFQMSWARADAYV